jgi:hypothetical protein
MIKLVLMLTFYPNGTSAVYTNSQTNGRPFVCHQAEAVYFLVTSFWNDLNVVPLPLSTSFDTSSNVIVIVAPSS